MTWRDKARPIIADVIARVGTSDMSSLRTALLAVCPWSRGYPHRVWLDEINVQLGTERPRQQEQGRRRKKSRRSDEDQPTLF